MGVMHRRAQEPIATNPRASTLEHAVVGVGGAPMTMRLRLRPSFRNVDTRGVDNVGNGTLDMFEVSVIVDGVVTDCSGGKTKRVWDGVGASTMLDDADERLEGVEGVEGIRSGAGSSRKNFGFGFDFVNCFGSGSGDLGPTGDGGTGGRRGGGLRILNLLGGADKLNDCFAAGAEGGGGSDPNVVLLYRADGGARNPKDSLVAGAVGGGRAVVGVKTYRGREDARASSSVASVLGDPLLVSAGISSRVTMLSSSSSKRSSLRTLRFVTLLATDPARLRPPWPNRLFQAEPMPIPEPVDVMEAVVECCEPFRATMRCSISKSRARASRISSTLSCSSSSGEASSSSSRLRPHSASSDASCEDRSEGVGEFPPLNERSYSRS
jgi:hypothetical protein